MIATEHVSRRGRMLVLAWCVALGTGLAVFHALGTGALAAPPLRPTGWSGWAEGRDPLVATVALLRLAALGLGWYLLAVTVAGLAARTARSARVARVVEVITVPAVRRLLHGALGVSVATAIVAAAPGGTGHAARAYAAAPGPDPTTVMDALPLPVIDAPDEAEPAPRTTPEPSEASDQNDAPEASEVPEATEGPEDLPEALLPFPLERLLSDAAPEGAGTDGGDAPGSYGTIDAAAIDPGDPAAHRPGVEHVAGRGADTEPGGSRAITVVPGDSLWSIARSALTTGGHEVDDAGVTTYWSRVVERNRDGLADPDNPDLIFPGDVVVLPDLPEREEVDR